MSEQKKRGPGRPRIEVDLDEVTELAAEGNKCKDIASVLGFSESTLFCRKDVRAAYDKGRAQLCVDLRHWQIQCAKSGNSQMLMWLGRQYLDQNDRKETVVETKNGQLADLIDGLREPCSYDLHTETTGADGAVADE